jgi:hypothetical protein
LYFQKTKLQMFSTTFGGTFALQLSKHRLNVSTVANEYFVTMFRFKIDWK